MSRSREPIDRLRDANPVPRDEAPGPDSPHAGALFDRIVGEPRAAKRARRRSMKRRALILLPAAVVVAVAAGYAISHAIRDPLVIACYQEPRLSATHAVVPPTDQDPVVACRTLWHAGSAFNPDGSALAPALRACVLPSGAVGVFPDTLAPDTCDALGLADPIIGSDAQQHRAVVGLENALATRFVADCIGRAQALGIAETELSRSRLIGWRVKVAQPFTTLDPCASVSIDATHHTVTLVPVGDSSS